MTANSDDPYQGFGHAIRTHWLEADNLKVNRNYSDEEILGDDLSVLGRKNEFGQYVAGFAKSKDAVKFIGQDKSTSEFTFTLSPDRELGEDGKHSLAWWWEFQNSQLESETGEAADFFRRRNSRLLEGHPTAYLGFTRADAELGLTDGWYLDCRVPTNVVDSLIVDILAGRVKEVKIGIEWIFGLVQDSHAPPAARTTWGLIPDHDDRSMSGNLNSLTWTLVGDLPPASS